MHGATKKGEKKGEVTFTLLTSLPLGKEPKIHIQ